jgi:hypothetical protein
MIQPFEAFLLHRLRNHRIEQRRRYQYRTIGIGHHDVVGEHRDAAATYRLLPADEGQAGHRGRRRRTLTPDR